MKKNIVFIGLFLFLAGVVLALVSTQFSLSARYATLQQPGYGDARQSLVLDEPVYPVGAGCQHVAIKYRLMYDGGSTKYPSGQLGSMDITAIYKTTIPNPVDANNLIKGFMADHSDKTYTGGVTAYAYYYCIDTNKIISKEPFAKYQLNAVVRACEQDACDGELYKECIFSSSGGSYYNAPITKTGKCGVTCIYSSECGVNQMCDTSKIPNSCVADCGSSTYEQRCYAGDAWNFNRCGAMTTRADDCTATETCSNGRCIPACTSHQYVGCYNNEVKYFNSCNQPEETLAGGVCGTSTCTVSGSTASCVKTCTPNYEKKCNGLNVYYRDSCGVWGNIAEDCTAQGKSCVNDLCVAPQQPTCGNKPIQPKCTYGTPQWIDYPDCKWDTSSCVDPCEPQKKYEGCYNGNVWWYNNCDKTTLISKACGVNQECQNNACVDVCKPISDLICEGNNVVQKDTCGKTIATPQICSSTEMCRGGKCEPIINKVCDAKPSRTCEGAVWMDYPSCKWDEAGCQTTIIDPCDNPTTPEQRAQCNKTDTGSLTLTKSQELRIIGGAIVSVLGVIAMVIGAIL